MVSEDEPWHHRTMDHAFFMQRCLELAAKGRRRVGNGAMVGAVLVRDGKIIADGYHTKFGNSHAERELLNKYEQEIRSDDVLYVNLEPCCHQGKTPPCTDILLERGVKKIVIGMLDPDPRVAGKGIELLRAAGVQVQGPVSRALCERFNRGFVTLRTKGRPWITLKKAQTKKGLIANADGSPMKITREEQNIWSHTFLRAESDAIIVGIQTVIIDDPKLDIRLDQNKAQIEGLNPYSIVIDNSLKIPLTSKLVTDEIKDRTIIVTEESQVDSDAHRELMGRGIRVTALKKGWSLPDLLTVLATPKDDFHGLGNILVEGGQKTWDAFREAELFDEDVTLVGT